MVYLGADTVEVVDTGASATSGAVSDVASLVKTVQYWDSQEKNANTAYEQAVAAKKAAEARRALAKARAARFLATKKWYIAGIGGGLLVAGVMAVYLGRKR